MNKLIAIAIICSISALIGFGGGVGVTYYINQQNEQKFYDLMRSCSSSQFLSIGNRLLLHSAFLEVLETGDEKITTDFKAIVKKELITMAVELRKSIDDAPSPEELERNKALLHKIEKQLNINAS